LKAKGFNPVQSAAIDLASTDINSDVNRKSANALCTQIAAAGISCVGTVAAVSCAFPAACCSSPTGSTLALSCTGGPRGEGFDLNRPANTDAFTVSQTSSVPGVQGDISNLSAENKNFYNDLRTDLAANSLVQVRPNGVLGTVQVKFFHTQGGQNPRTASTSISAGNVGNPAQIAADMATAINGTGLAGVVATATAGSAAGAPLTYSPGTLGGVDFVRITIPVSVTDVELIGVPGQHLTIESTENTPDYPAMGTWSFIAVLTLLLVSGYWLMRRRARSVAA